MNKILLLLMLAMTACSSVIASNHESADSTHTDLNSFESKESEEFNTEEEETQKEEETVKMKLEIGDHIFSAVLEKKFFRRCTEGTACRRTTDA